MGATGINTRYRGQGLKCVIPPAIVTIVGGPSSLYHTVDKSFSLHQHIMNTCRATYIELRPISSIRHFLSVHATKTLTCSLVLSKLDSCNSLLSGSPQYLVQLFQKVQNTAAQITLRAPRVEHTSPLLCSLHWLPIRKRIKHKVCSITRTALFSMLR